ncbi:RND family efflux transporter MFP subunit [Pontibacter ummariensis]|uniref:RND family efflux transporter, MFP subunit n=1 Tax=Pontibacter ummariensis TaxID=1610492 RepID=A0A239L2E7_9BACT|nr:efflux RND transporter periplasmic adaptor subunit [Pontibacter ummariensis]PRY04612.1 RND family efflux transporter MFP subunit [Pontibacter ummariensis]SNT24142.1 RND family efflux transporter, MFP subunit [Pontibacter ummariensis]
MKRILGISSLALVLGLTACGGEDKEAELTQLKEERERLDEQIAALEAELKAGGQAVATEKKTVPVSVTAVEQDTFRHYLEMQGKVDFDQNVLVSPKVGGVLTSVRVEPGDRVSKGQTLATIDAQVLEQNMAEVRTRLDLARIAYEKQENLWNQKIGTEMQYLTAKNNKEALERSLATLQQQREQYNVTSPISGTVDNVIPNAGEAVMPGMGIVRVVNTQGGKIVAEVSETYQDKINKGDKAVVYFPDLKKEVETTVGVVSQYIDPVSRTFTVELSLQNGQNITFRPNMVAVVRIQDYQNEGVVVLPVNLVQKDENRQYVYVAQKQDNQYVAVRKEIETGMSYNGKVEVLSGLTGNEQVITAGYQSLNEGQPVVFAQQSLTQK